MKTKILTILKNSETHISGQSLSNQLGVSRTAIWKVINQLKEEGYIIEAVPNKGYRIVAYPDIVTAEEIKSLLRTKEIGKEVRYYDIVDSTNTKAKQLAEQENTHGLLVIAEQQEMGKGRRGKTWSSQKGMGIWMSLIVKPKIKPVSASMLTLIAALAVTKAIRQIEGEKENKHFLDAKIKWPNDIVVNGKKVCGILTEMSSELDYINHIVIGIGINANIEKFPDKINNIATSLLLEGKKHIKRSQLVASVLEAFEEYYMEFLKTENLETMITDYNRWLINYEKEVKIIEENITYTGMAKGITPTGELIVILPDGTRKKVVSGEVSVRGLYGYV